MNYALYCTDCGSNITEYGYCGLCFFGEPVRQIEHNTPPKTDKSHNSSASSLIDKYHEAQGRRLHE